MAGILDIIANDNYILVNKSVAHAIGLNEAILLGELASEYNYYKKHNQLQYDWFFSTIENIQKNTTLTGRQQRPALNHLEELKLLEQENRGLPQKRFFKLNVKNIEKFISSLPDSQ